MNDDWKPSQYKPRGGWRATLPGGRMLVAVPWFAGVVAVKLIVHDQWSRDLSFDVMMVSVVVVAMACVAPHRIFGKPSPDPFPTERRDDDVQRHDDETA